MSRFVLVDEADTSRRFVLQEEPQQDVAQRAGSAINNAITRQVPLTARAGMQGAGGLVGVLSDPIAAALNLTGLPRKLTGSNIPFARQTLAGTADAIGLPIPETPSERVGVGGAELLAGSAGSIGAGRFLAQSASPVVQQIGNALSQAPRQQLSAAVGAGTAGGLAREGGAGPGGEAAAALVGSVLGGMVPGQADRAAGAVRSAFARPTPQQVDIKIQQILQNQGVSMAALPGGVKFALRKEVAEALRTGNELNPDAVRRLADYRTIGATPRRSTLTLDPVQITREKNLSKIAANSGLEDLYDLPRIENRNNRTFIETLNEVRGADVKPKAAGEAAIGAVQAKDARLRAAETARYTAAREAAGRQIPLDRERFVYDAYRRLAEANKGGFLPDDIGATLENIRNGVIRRGGQEFQVPFNVDVIDSLKTSLATASRNAKDGNVRAAIREVRAALDAAQPARSPVTQAFGGNQVTTPAVAQAMQNANELPAQAMQAFDRARKIARLRRTWQESSPAVQAALDDAAPDTFIKNFIIDAKSSDDVAAFAKELRRDPAAFDLTRRAIVEHLKDQALNKASDEVGKFSQSNYNKAIKSLREKLPLFFKQEEIAKLETLGRVASYEMVQPVGAAVNNSASGATVVGRALDGIVGISRRLPAGRTLIGDPLQSWQVSVNARDMANMAPGLLAARPPTPTLTSSALLPAALSLGLLSAP